MWGVGTWPRKDDDVAVHLAQTFVCSTSRAFGLFLGDWTAMAVGIDDIEL